MMNKNKKYAIGLFATAFVLSFSVAALTAKRRQKQKIVQPLK